MRTNGTREQASELLRINRQIDAAQEAARVIATLTDGITVADALSDAWNALHDAVTALEAERRTVELNAPVADATALLVHRNID